MHINVKTYTQKYTDINTKIETLAKKIQQETIELEKLKKRNYWLGQIIHPLAKDLGKAIDKPFVKIGSPMGIHSNIWIEFHKTQKSMNNPEKGTYKSIVLFPGDLSKGQIYIHNLKKKIDKYPIGSLGAENMGNFEVVDTTGMKLQELIKYIF